MNSGPAACNVRMYVNRASTLSSCSSTSSTLSPFSASSCSAMGRRRRLTCPILPDRPALAAAMALSAQHPALYMELYASMQRMSLNVMQEHPTTVHNERPTTCLAVKSMTEHRLGRGLMWQSSLLSSHLQLRSDPCCPSLCTPGSANCAGAICRCTLRRMDDLQRKEHCSTLDNLLPMVSSSWRTAHMPKS